jgi:hypothetical protein
MQIHELNNKKNSKQVQESWTDALKSNTAMAQAKQAARQQSAAGLADKLSRQGYTVSGSNTFQQQLQSNLSNAAIQQQVGTLSSQWASQRAALNQATVTETAVAQFNPRDLEDPKYAAVLRALQAQGKDPTKPVDTKPAANIELEKQLSAKKLEFNNWVRTKLSNLGINVDVIQRNSEVKEILDSALSEIAVAAQSGNADLEKQAVEKYLNAAIAGNMFVRSGGASTQTPSQPVPTTQTAAKPSAEVDLLSRNNIQLSADQLQALNLAVRSELKGGTTIRNTGSAVLNALAKAAGLEIGQ